jgi:hypothetical protein
MSAASRTVCSTENCVARPMTFTRSIASSPSRLIGVVLGETALKSFEFHIFKTQNLEFSWRRGCVDLRCACGAGTLWAFDSPWVLHDLRRTCRKLMTRAKVRPM